VISARNRFSNA